MSHTKQELSYIKNDYKRTAEAEPKKEKTTSIWKPILLFTLKLLLKTIYYLTIGFIQICVVIFMIMLFAPLYMFFGVKPKYRRRRW